MSAVAVAGTTLLALSPVRALAMPRTFSEGRLISSTSFRPPPSVRPSASSRISSRIDLGSLGDGALFGLGERLDAVVEVVDQHAPVVVLHGRQQARQRHRGVGRPVAVVAAVQFVAGPVESDLDAGDAARAEHDLLAAALMHGPIANQPDIAGQQLFVFGNDLRQMRRTASSSPSKTNLILERSGIRAALRASSAVVIAASGALSSLAERA